jgi:Peptidase_C39 like family
MSNQADTRKLLARIRRRFAAKLLSTIALGWIALPFPVIAFDARGVQFIGFSHFRAFDRSSGQRPGEEILTSPVLQARIQWNELIASWNAQTPGATHLKIEARALYPGHETKYYTMGLWSSNAAPSPRQSVSGQKDDDGDVATDTLTLSRSAECVQVRVTLQGDALDKPILKFLGVCLADTKTAPPPLPANRAAWGRLIAVPERSQMAYPNGKVLCSPTTVSMLMAYWAGELHRPELDQGVPAVVQGVYDANWKGAGNWPFNMAYAGSFPGMRAYVTRMTDLSELETWVAAGIPVGMSVCYDRLRGEGPGPNGHLVVCLGFTDQGDPIINDPGTSKHVRKVFPRKNLAYAWSYSHNTAYLVYPSDSEIPADRFGHWDSWTSHRRILFQ